MGQERLRKFASWPLNFSDSNHSLFHLKSLLQTRVTRFIITMYRSSRHVIPRQQPADSAVWPWLCTYTDFKKLWKINSEMTISTLKYIFTISAFILLTLSEWQAFISISRSKIHYFSFGLHTFNQLSDCVCFDCRYATLNCVFGDYATFLYSFQEDDFWWLKNKFYPFKTKWNNILQLSLMHVCIYDNLGIPYLFFSDLMDKFPKRMKWRFHILCLRIGLFYKTTYYAHCFESQCIFRRIINGGNKLF